eukprot:3625162-Prymnesium_polylepis.1
MIARPHRRRSHTTSGAQAGVRTSVTSTLELSARSRGNIGHLLSRRHATRTSSWASRGSRSERSGAQPLKGELGRYSE